MLTVDRLVDGINGEDPGGARLYMSQLRENEVRFPDSSIQNVARVGAESFSLSSCMLVLPLPLSPRRGHAFADSLYRFLLLAGIQVSVF